MRVSAHAVHGHASSVHTREWEVHESECGVHTHTRSVQEYQPGVHESEWRVHTHTLLTTLDIVCGRLLITQACTPWTAGKITDRVEAAARQSCSRILHRQHVLALPEPCTL